ncbi:MAG: radical SAM protein [Pseudomonadota bacterium]|nr:radical SAM protein [Pseudomonadota bacterium]
MFLRNILNLAGGRIPGQLVIQYTNSCNAFCPQCGMRAGNRIKRSTLKLDEVKKTIDCAAKNSFQALSLTGGEPLLYLNDICTLLDYAGTAGIKYLRTGTNGFYFRNLDNPANLDRVKKIADRLAATPLRNFWISIDSSDLKTHETMRGFPGLFAGIEKALPIFHERGLYPSANLSINRNLAGFEKTAETQLQTGKEELFLNFFRAAFHDFYQKVIGLGFTIVNTCYPMSIDENNSELAAVYDATSLDNCVNFSREEKILVYRALSEVIPHFRDQVRIFTPLNSLYGLISQHQNDEKEIPGYACRGGKEFFFVAAENGNTYPCGFRGQDNYGKFWHEGWKKKDESSCTACDWECFRDPAEMFGPWQELWNRPINLTRRVWFDPGFIRDFSHDLTYYRACDYFDGRMAPNCRKLASFSFGKESCKTKRSSFNSRSNPKQIRPVARWECAG